MKITLIALLCASILLGCDAFLPSTPQRNKILLRMSSEGWKLPSTKSAAAVLLGLAATFSNAEFAHAGPPFTLTGSFQGIVVPPFQGVKINFFKFGKVEYVCPNNGDPAIATVSLSLSAPEIEASQACETNQIDVYGDFQPTIGPISFPGFKGPLFMGVKTENKVGTAGSWLTTTKEGIWTITSAP